MAHSSETVRQALINPQGIVWRALSRQIPVPAPAVVVRRTTFFNILASAAAHAQTTLAGLLPRQFVASELLERVEVFRGANTYINGAPRTVSATVDF